MQSCTCFKYLSFQPSDLSVPDEGYSRNALCALNLISTFYHLNNRNSYNKSLIMNPCILQDMLFVLCQLKCYARKNFIKIVGNRLFILSSITIAMLCTGCYKNSEKSDDFVLVRMIYTEGSS